LNSNKFEYEVDVVLDRIHSQDINIMILSRACNYKCEVYDTV